MQASFKEPFEHVETLSKSFIVHIGIPLAPQARLYVTFGDKISNRRPNESSGDVGEA
jgi:hypothetical protein